MTIAEAVVDKLPIAVYAIDDDRFVYVNAKFAETLGYTKDEILALESAVDIIPGGQKKIVREILRRRAAGTLDEFRYITTARRRDGTLIDAQIHGSVADIDSGRIAIGAAVDIAPHLELSRRLIVSMHGGTIEATSDGPGRGATFAVTLPVAAAA